MDILVKNEYGLVFFAVGILLLATIGLQVALVQISSSNPCPPGQIPAVDNDGNIKTGTNGDPICNTIGAATP
jgi:hypothetical protein